jgi:glutaredoxin
MLSTLSRWLRFRQRGPQSALPVTVYTRAGCGCCVKARQVLEPFERRGQITIDAVDVDTDPDLVARYGQTVPVVAVGGKVRFRGIVDPMLLRRLIDAEARR